MVCDSSRSSVPWEGSANTWYLAGQGDLYDGMRSYQPVFRERESFSSLSGTLLGQPARLNNSLSSSPRPTSPGECEVSGVSWLLDVIGNLSDLVLHNVHCDTPQCFNLLNGQLIIPDLNFHLCFHLLRNGRLKSDCLHLFHVLSRRL